MTGSVPVIVRGTTVGFNSRNFLKTLVSRGNKISLIIEETHCFQALAFHKVTENTSLSEAKRVNTIMLIISQDGTFSTNTKQMENFQRISRIDRMEDWYLLIHGEEASISI